MKIIIKNDNRDIVKNPNVKIIETTEASFINQTVFIEENDVPIIKYTDTESMYFVKDLDNLYDRKSKSEVLLNITIDNLELIGRGSETQHSYSTDETSTGGTWIDGKPIYKKVSDINIPTVNPEYIDLSSYFPNTKILINATPIIDLTNEDGRKMFGNTLETYTISFDFRDNYVGMYCTNFDQTPNERLGVADKITVILEYTKTTD